MAPQSVAQELLRVGLRSHLLMEWPCFCPAPAWPRGAALSDVGVLWVGHAHGKALGARPACGLRAAALFRRKGDASYLCAFSPRPESRPAGGDSRSQAVRPGSAPAGCCLASREVGGTGAHVPAFCIPGGLSPGSASLSALAGSGVGRGTAASRVPHSHRCSLGSLCPASLPRPGRARAVSTS